MESDLSVLLLVMLAACVVLGNQRPHIVLIMADDLGWNDVGFHGSNQIPTPNIDAMACSGLILNNYYVTAICTPSRSALMTGRHPIHNGMQHTVLYGAEPRGLPLDEQLLPQHLRQLGYATHLVGKWHLGHFRREYTPTHRGFDTHLGYWTGHHDYNDHTAVEKPFWGLDMRRGMEPAWDLHGQYSTDVFTAEAVRLIRAHNASRPLFLYVAHAAVHSANPYNPLPAPDSVVAAFAGIANYQRRRFAAMLSKLDESVGKVVQALQQAGMLHNCVFVFTTDNGGPAHGFNLNAASNWPLRGVKNTLWEGGIRGAGLLWSPLLAQPGRVANQLFHMTDWLPTLYSAAGGDTRNLGNIDGLDAWEAMSQNIPSNRSEVLHNIDDIIGNAALTVGDWKIVTGSSYNGEWDGWYGPSGREDGSYDANKVLSSPAARSLAAAGWPLTADKIHELRAQAQVHCSPQEAHDRPFSLANTSSVPCKPLQAPCLFHVRTDPCEKRNLADRFPGLLRHLQQRLAEINATAVPPSNVPWDPRADPRFWDHTWSNFGDHSIIGNAVN